MKGTGEHEIADVDGWFRSVMNMEINAASTSHLRTAAKTLREKAATAT